MGPTTGQVSGSYTIPTSVSSGSVHVTVTWDDGYNQNTSATATYTRPTNCQSSPSISTQASGPVTVGAQIHDVATLSGAVGA